jgi:D-3-phosphoglycerate dehydrogenase
MVEARPKIVVSETLSESALARLAAVGEVVRLSKCDEAALIAAVRDADALVVRTYSNVTAKVIEAAKQSGRLRVIGRAGVGLDNIDTVTAANANITVVYTPAACTDAVAELVVGLIVALQREIVANDRKMREGEFAKLRAGIPRAIELQHQTLGVIGMGRIGQSVSRRLHLGMNMRVIYYDIRDVGPLKFAAAAQASAEAVYQQADVITMHVPLTPKTNGMINAKSLSRFKPGSFLVNTSRGPVVNAAALADALKAGKLAGAAIDVFDPEPPPPDHPLFSAPNCILTPHVASRTREGIEAMNDVVDDVIAVLQGRQPRFSAEPEQ